MLQKKYDIVLLTQREYVDPLPGNNYTDNILLEDKLLINELKQCGLKVIRKSWDDPDFDWSSTSYALFRATWDYFHRFEEFNSWLNNTAKLTCFINSYSLIQENIDKRYLQTLQQKDINIPPTLFLDRNESRTLQKLLEMTGWERAILKPAIAGGARHTYLIDYDNVDEYQSIFAQLNAQENMLLQQFQEQIATKGEVSFIVFGGTYSHAVLKKVKEGDFRVQDDFGGTVHPYIASEQERSFVEKIIEQLKCIPVYARVDVMWDNNNNLCLSELEMLEPELWLRIDKNAAKSMSTAIYNHINIK
ncbi:MAG TPA: hypothetical protein PK657_00955 [Legionella sp.]|nr:hypothetical protein [Legionella sp.]